MSGENVGKISLDIELKANLSKQINSVANNIGSGLSKSLNSTIKNTLSNSIKGAKSSTEKAVRDMTSGIRKMQLSKPASKVMPQSTLAPRQKNEPQVDTKQAEIQLKNLSALLENTNGRIEVQRRKLNELRESYNLLSDRSLRKNQMEEEMLKTESAMLKLIKQSDDTRKKIDKLEDSMNQVGKTTSDTGEQMERTGKSAVNMGNRVQRMANSFYAAVRRIARQAIVFAVIYKAIRSLQTFIGSAMQTNDEFTKSLVAVRTNLQVAFAPIFGIVNSALTWFMQKLATTIQYVAAFIAGLFGMTYEKAVNTARGIHKARQAMDEYGKSVKEAHRHIMGFDELNVMEKPPAIPSEPPIPQGIGVDFDAALAAQNMETLKKLEEIGRRIREVWELVKPVILHLWDTILSPFFSWVWGKIKRYYNIWKNILQDVVKENNTIGGVLKGIWDIVWDTIKRIAKRTWDRIVEDWKEAIAKIPERWKNKMEELKRFGFSTVETIKSYWREFVSWFKANVTDRISKFFKDLWNNKVNEVRQRHENLKNAWNRFTTWFKTNTIDRISNFFRDLWNRGNNEVRQTIDNIRGRWTTFTNWIKAKVTDPLGIVFNSAWTRVRSYSTGAWNNLVNTWHKARDWFKNSVTDPIANLFKSVFNRIADNFNKTLGNFKVSIPNWVPGNMGGKTFSFPKIPKLARGGIIDQPTLAMVGEAGKEAVMPLENNTGWIDQLAGKIAGIIDSGGGSGNNENQPIIIKIGDDTILETMITAAQRKNTRAGKTVVNLGV